MNSTSSEPQLSGAEMALRAVAVASAPRHAADTDAVKAVRRYVLPMARGLVKRAARMERCGTGAGYVLQKDGESVGFRHDRCRDRGCGRCWHLSVSKHEPMVRDIADKAVAAGYSMMFVTLTRRVDRLREVDPRDTIATTREAFRHLRQRMRRDKAVAGGWTRLETTWKGSSAKRGAARCHAHLHVVLLCAPGADPNAAAARLVDRWRVAVADVGSAASLAGQDAQLIARGDGPPVDTGKVRRYVLKYTLKPSELSDPATWGLQAYALRGQRLFQSWGEVHAATRSTSALASIAREVRDAHAAERARYSVPRIGDAAARAIPQTELEAVIALGRSDCPLFRAWVVAAEAFEQWHVAPSPSTLRAVRDALALCPIGASTLYLAPSISAPPGPPNEDKGDNGDYCDAERGERQLANGPASG